MANVVGREPVLTLGAICAVIVFVLANFGIVVDINTVHSIILAVIPLITALIQRQHVTPVS